MSRMWAVAALALMLSDPAIAGGRCPISSDLAALRREPDRVFTSLVLAPMYCSNAREGIYCFADDETPQVLMIGMYLGKPTSVAMAEAVRRCSPGQTVSTCRFAVDLDAITIDAGRRADKAGWGLIKVKADRVDLLPVKCPE